MVDIKDLEEGASIEFDFQPSVFGIGSKHVHGSFVRYDPREDEVIYRKRYFDPVSGMSTEKRIKMSSMRNLRSGYGRSTGPR
tara:strand:- start:126 stop:371 length:246 start_codon:yes stop_codon:yes gene_type:complete